MAAAVQRGQEAAGLSSTEGCKEAVQGILKALQLCVGKLQQTNDAVSFAINWDKIQCLPSVGPTFLSSVLHQHICDLQPLLDRLQSLSNGNGEKSVGLERAEESHCTLDVIEPKERVDADITSKLNTNNVLVDSNCVTNPAAVQIQARKSEIDRRILAFIERKQAEINENNVREFCNVIDCNQENSCARTDAVFTPFPGFKSHVKVSRVLNAYGPQTRTDSSASSSRAHSLPQESGNQAVEERLQNIECHLRLKQGGPVPKDIYQRIKKLEDRILELEGISPEYFQSMDVSSKRKKVQASQNYSLVELDQKINALRQTLIQKSKRETSRTDVVLA